MLLLSSQVDSLVSIWTYGASWKMSIQHLWSIAAIHKHILDIVIIIEYMSQKWNLLRMIDEISLRILKILQKKARIPNVEVARQVGMAPSAVLERIRKLEKQGYIDGYEVRLNPQRFRRGMVGFVHLLTDTGADESIVAARLSAIEEIQEIHFIAGEDGYLIKVRVAGTEELNKLVREKIRPIAGVSATRTSVALSTIKETTRITIDNQFAK
jgi:Lrp/AsnC family transcriptional regulator, leucine-responsive regulatory protein